MYHLKPGVTPDAYGFCSYKIKSQLQISRKAPSQWNSSPQHEFSVMPPVTPFVWLGRRPSLAPACPVRDVPLASPGGPRSLRYESTGITFIRYQIFGLLLICP